MRSVAARNLASASGCIADPLRLERHRRAIGSDQLGPDQMPVAWAQVPAHYGAVGGALDFDAVQRGWPTTIVDRAPLPHLISIQAEPTRERCHRLRTWSGEVLVQVHQTIVVAKAT